MTVFFIFLVFFHFFLPFYLAHQIELVSGPCFFFFQRREKPIVSQFPENRPAPFIEGGLKVIFDIKSASRCEHQPKLEKKPEKSPGSALKWENPF